jgi:hypothetical protein
MTTLGRLVGHVDRGGFDATTKTFATWSNAAYNSILGGLVIKGGAVSGGLAWSELQTSAGAPPGSHALAAAGTTYIDHMFDQADAYNNTNPVLSGTTTPMLWTLLLRIFSGENAPAWAQALAGGPISFAGNTTGCWWTTGANSWIAAYLNFMSVLAAYVPSYTVRSVTSSGGLPVGVNTQPLAGHPLLGQVVCAPTMTLFAETMTKDDFFKSSSGAYAYPVITNGALPTPYTLALDEAALSSTFATMDATWGTTPISLSHNPFIEVIGTGTGKASHEPETETLMTSFTGATTWPSGVLANNSLRSNGLTLPPADGSNPGAYADPHGADYTSMYTKMAGFGKSAAAHVALALGAVGASPMPIEIQTSTYSGMGSTVANLLATIDYAAWIGARAVELPGDSGGYTNASLAQLAAKVPELLANDPANAVPVPTAGSVMHWRAFRHR